MDEIKQKLKYNLSQIGFHMSFLQFKPNTPHLTDDDRKNYFFQLIEKKMEIEKLLACDDDRLFMEAYERFKIKNLL
jgi:hypothetical protein